MAKLRGSSQNWTGDQIAIMSKVGEADAAEALRAWQRVMPRAWGSLPIAGAAGSRFGFNPDRLLYTLNGKTVPAVQIKKAFNTALDNWGASLQKETKRLFAGELKLGDWQQQMADTVRAIQTNAMIIGRGGVAEITREDALYLEGELKFQNERLSRFALQVERGEVQEDQAMARAQLYANAGNPTMEESRRAAAEDNGMDEERRVLGAAEHCETCVYQAGREWQALGSLLQIGDAECKWNCRCHFVYRNSKAAAEAEGPREPGAQPGQPEQGRPVSVTVLLGNIFR